MESLSPSDKCEERKLEERSDSVLCLHVNNTVNRVSILQLLDTESSVGTQRQIQGVHNEKRVCVVNSSERSSVLTACVGDRGVKATPPARVNNCYAVCQRDEVIKRHDHHQTTARCASWAEQCDSVQHLRLYPCWQGIRSQLSPIIEQDESCGNTAITSLKVSQQRLMIMPLSSFVICSHCSAERGNVADMANNTSDCSAFRCMLTSGQKAGQGRIVSDRQAMDGEPPGVIITISGQDELDGCFSCDSNAR